MQRHTGVPAAQAGPYLPRCGGLTKLQTRTSVRLPQRRGLTLQSSSTFSVRSAATPVLLEQASPDSSEAQPAASVQDIWSGDFSIEQQRQRQASGAAASSSDSVGLCKHEADVVFYPTKQTRASLKKYENARITHRHSVMSATNWQTIADIFDRSYGYNLFATSSALMLHRLARMRAQNLKRKRRKLAPTEELHAPKKVVQKMLNVCLTQARAFAARDMLAVLYGVEGLNVILAPEQLQILDDRAAVLLPLFHERELPRYLDLRAAYKQPISPALSHALRQQWLGSIDGPSLPLREAARALPLLLPDVMDGKALAQICIKVEADVPSMTPPELVRLLVSLVSLAKQGAPLPMQTVNALADAVAKWASQWDLSEAATALSCVLQLAVSSDRAQHRDAAHSVQKSSAQTSAMSRTVVEAVGAGIAKTNRKAGSTATLGGKRRPLSLTNVINVAFQLGMTTAPECVSTLMTTLQSSTLADLSVLDAADLMKVIAEWRLAEEHKPLVEALCLVVLRNKRRASDRTRSCVQHSLSLLQQELSQPGPRMQSLLDELARPHADAHLQPVS